MGHHFVHLCVFGFVSSNTVSLTHILYLSVSPVLIVLTVVARIIMMRTFVQILLVLALLGGALVRGQDTSPAEQCIACKAACPCFTPSTAAEFAICQACQLLCDIDGTCLPPCPDQSCAHSAQFWQTFNCFGDDQGTDVPWPFGGITTDGTTWAFVIGFDLTGQCMLNFTGILGNQDFLNTNLACLASLDGAEFVLADLTGSTNETALMLQQFYTHVINLLYGLQALNGPCPVGPGGLPPGVPPSRKRLTLVELAVVTVILNSYAPFFDATNSIPGANCDFSQADSNLVSLALDFYTARNNGTVGPACVENFGDRCEGGCTLSQGFWRNHNRDDGDEPWPGTDSEDRLLCNVTWLDWMTLRRGELSQFGNAQRILARQWISSNLNELGGACTTIAVSIALSDAETLLDDNCGNSVKPSDPDGRQMIQLSSLLGEYNEGSTGPGNCDFFRK